MTMIKLMIQYQYRGKYETFHVLFMYQISFSISQPFEFHEMNFMSNLHNRSSNGQIEGLTSIVNRDELSINQTINESINRANVDTNNQQKFRTVRVNLLKSCCAWLWGLDDDTTELYQKPNDNDDSNEYEQYSSTQTKRQSITKWLLNSNLVLLLLIQLTLFIVLSIPIKYTFLKT